MRVVLITGSTGFIGQSVMDQLSGLDYQVHCLHCTPHSESTLTSQANHHFSDLNDCESLRLIIRKVQPDYVIHLAALSSVAASFDKPAVTMTTNLVGTINLAEACRLEAKTLKQFISTGSSEEYGPILSDRLQKINESSLVKPGSPYAVSKVASTLYLEYLYNAYQFPVTIIRPFNTYGRTNQPVFFIERIIKHDERRPICYSTGKGLSRAMDYAEKQA